MFDLAWSEIAVIVVVAIVVIGPKDLPDTIRTVAKGIGKLRRMAGELQGHLDEVVREAKLEDVRDRSAISGTSTSRARSSAPWTRTARSAPPSTTIPSALSP